MLKNGNYDNHFRQDLYLSAIQLILNDYITTITSILHRFFFYFQYYFHSSMGFNSVALTQVYFLFWVLQPFISFTFHVHFLPCTLNAI